MFKVKRMDFLVSLYIFGILVAELLGAKTFPLLKIGTYTLNASVAFFIIPLLFTINDVIVEVHGAARARSVVRSGLIMIILLFFYIMFAMYLPPSKRFAESEAAYDSVFGKSARIAFASLTAFALADFLDIYLFSQIREKMGKSKLWLRNNLSNIISSLIDTVVFMTLAFYALDKTPADNWTFLISLIIPYWLLKCSMSVIETPFVYLGVRWLKEESKENKK
jgi:uncharacterized integral membrane protein (TIGR00697 family)